MSKNRESGFQEGTSHITTGDKMKFWDHRRQKTNCKYHKNSFCCLRKERCCGSSHCLSYDDGIAVIEKPDTTNYKRLKNDVNEFVERLQFKIPIDTPEGKIISKYIMARFDLSEEDIAFYDEQQKMFFHIQNELRSQYSQKEYAEKVIRLQKKIIDEQLANRVKGYENEIEQYSSEKSKIKLANTDKEDRLLESAEIKFNLQDYTNSKHDIIKSIEKHNTKAMIWLAIKYWNGDFFEQNRFRARALLLYASYLGNEAAKQIVFAE